MTEKSLPEQINDLIKEGLYQAIGQFAVIKPDSYGAPFKIENKKSEYPETIKIYTFNQNWGVSVTIDVEVQYWKDKSPHELHLFEMQIYDDRKALKDNPAALYGFWRNLKLIADLAVNEVVNRLEHTKSLNRGVENHD
ncbi:hypothetical protein [Nitrospira sp. BLG_2]|uniref:hypothetical protein n=1 Tax=Nitrospira sp. BLG_2 TaxID=3397507 RepID=UPI003B9B00CB